MPSPSLRSGGFRVHRRLLLFETVPDSARAAGAERAQTTNGSIAVKPHQANERTTPKKDAQLVDFAGPKQIRARGPVRSGRLPPGGRRARRGAFPAPQPGAPGRLRVLPPRRPRSAGPGSPRPLRSPLPIPRRDAEQPSNSPAVSAWTVRAPSRSARGFENGRNEEARPRRGRTAARR